MKKVYSIWICMNAPNHIGNALAEYRIGKTDIVGTTPDRPENYDKLSVVMLMLNQKKDKRDESIFHFLNTVFSPDLSQKEKQNRLKIEFGIDDKREELEEEMNVMCNLSEAIEERALNKGDFIRLSSQIRKKIQKNLPTKECAEQLEEDVTVVECIYKLISQNPDMSDADIYKEYQEYQEKKLEESKINE